MASVEFKDVKKIYKTGEVVINALSDATFEIEKGEFCVVLGASGAGKTTMLNILGGMDILLFRMSMMNTVKRKLLKLNILLI